VDRIVERLLARSPADRYGSAAEVRDALAGTHVRRAPADVTPRATLATPRSAPTLPFASAAIAPTEVTEVAVLPAHVRPRPHVASIALAVILVVGGALVVHGARTGGDQLVPPLASEEAGSDSVVRDSAVAPPATTPAGGTTATPIALPPVVARVDTPKPKPAAKPVDSAAIRARNALRAQAESLAKLAEAVPTPVKDQIQRYANAIESLSVEKLKDAYPNLTPKQQEMWEKTVFGIATSVNTSVHYGAITKTDEKADVDFTLNVSFRYANGTRGSMPQMKQHATLLKTPSGWQIVEIR